MQYYITENINRLALNPYLADVFTKGYLQTRYEQHAEESLEPAQLMREFENNIFSFIAKYENLKFPDFIYMRNMDISSADIKTVLMLLRYGSGCQIYLDRTVLRWSIQGLYKDKNVTRHLRALELYVETELEKENLPLLKFKRIIDAQKAGHFVNMAFYNYTRNMFGFRVGSEGILVDVDFLILNVLMKSKSVFATNFFGNILKVFKANTDYTTYITEIGRFQTNLQMCSKRIGQLVTSSSEENVQINSLYGDSFTTITAPDIEKLISEVLQDEPHGDDMDTFEDQTADDDEEEVSTTVAKTNKPRKYKTKLMKKHLSESTADDNDDTILSDNEDAVTDNEEIQHHVLHDKIIYFWLSQSQRKMTKSLAKKIRTIMSKSCSKQNLNKKESYCVLLYCDETSYRFVTRQVYTARGVLSQQEGQLVCGWSGLCHNTTKTIILSKLKSLPRRTYSIKRTQLFNIKDPAQLIDDVSNILSLIENTSTLDRTFEQQQLAGLPGATSSPHEPPVYNITIPVLPASLEDSGMAAVYSQHQHTSAVTPPTSMYTPLSPTHKAIMIPEDQCLVPMQGQPIAKEQHIPSPMRQQQMLSTETQQLVELQVQKSTNKASEHYPQIYTDTLANPENQFLDIIDFSHMETSEFEHNNTPNRSYLRGNTSLNTPLSSPPPSPRPTQPDLSESQQQVDFFACQNMTSDLTSIMRRIY